jgi:hypothetical protein
MKKALQILARVLLGVLTGLFTFVIAACYGAMYSYQRGGRVVDARSQQGVPGARVLCKSADGSSSESLTQADGSFVVDSSRACREIVVQDPNGAYAEQTVAVPPNGEVDIALTPSS